MPAMNTYTLYNSVRGCLLSYSHSQMIDRGQALKLLLATPVLSHSALGQPPQADPFTDKISSAMQGFVADGKLVSAVGLIFQQGRLLFEDAVGYSDLAAKTPIRTD